jgi:hypothetical protein
MNKQKVATGQIWQVTTDEFKTSGKHSRKGYMDRQTILNRTEYIEIRYPYEWHFRTCNDNQYFHCTEEMLLENAVLIGIINPDINFANKHKLKEIIINGLYEVVNNE